MRLTCFFILVIFLTNAETDLRRRMRSGFSSTNGTPPTMGGIQIQSDSANGGDGDGSPSAATANQQTKSSAVAGSIQQPIKSSDNGVCAGSMIEKDKFPRLICKGDTICRCSSKTCSCGDSDGSSFTNNCCNCGCPSCEILCNENACPITSTATFYPLNRYLSQLSGYRCCGSFDNSAKTECENFTGWDYKGYETTNYNAHICCMKLPAMPQSETEGSDVGGTDGPPPAPKGYTHPDGGHEGNDGSAATDCKKKCDTLPDKEQPMCYSNCPSETSNSQETDCKKNCESVPDYDKQMCYDACKPVDQDNDIPEPNDCEKNCETLPATEQGMCYSNCHSTSNPECEKKCEGKSDEEKPACYSNCQLEHTVDNMVMEVDHMISRVDTVLQHLEKNNNHGGYNHHGESGGYNDDDYNETATTHHDYDYDYTDHHITSIAVCTVGLFTGIGMGIFVAKKFIGKNQNGYNQIPDGSGDETI